MKQIIKDKLILKEKYDNEGLKELSGYASEDMPWLKYITKEDISHELPEVNTFDYIYNYGKDNLSDIALIYPNAISDKRWSYKKLFNEIEKTKNAFINLGVRKHDIVTIATSNTPEAIFSFYALMKLGVIVNMVHPLSSSGEINAILLKTDSKFFVTYEGALDGKNNIDKINEAIKKTKVKKVIITNPSEQMPKLLNIIYTKKSKECRNFVYENDKKYIEWKKFQKDNTVRKNFGKHENKSSDVACLLCTGGSTGISKLVELTHDNLNKCTETIRITNKNLTPGKEATIVVMPLFHGFGLVNCLHLALVSGVKATLMPKFTGKEFVKYTKKYKTTITLGVPKIFATMMEHGENLSMKNQKVLIYGGDKLTKDLDVSFSKFLKSHDANEPLKGAFGLTECVAAATITEKEVINKKATCDIDVEVTNIGIPFPHNDVMIVKNKTFEEINGYNKLGVICIAGPTVAKGYYKEKNATKETFFKYKNKNWLYTGDMGFIDEESGSLFYAQREKRLVISNGYNIHPAEVEKHINKIGVVRQSVLIGVPDEKKGELPVLFVKVKYNQKIKTEDKLIEEIKTVIKNNLPKYAQVKDILVIEDMPLTKMNKINVSTLKDIYEETKK